MTEKILIVEDETDVADLLSHHLKSAGFSVETVYSGRAALQALKNQIPTLVVLDLMLPEISGLDLCRLIKSEPRTSKVPVVMLSARSEEIDRVLGFELGADDYLPKPFEPRELLARLRAILRRSRATAPGEKPLTFGRLEIDTAAHAVRLDGVQCELTGYQFDLLVTLAKNAGRVLSRDALLDAVKGEQLESFDRSIDVHVSRIRAAIEDNPKKPRRVITVRGSGYVFAKAQD